VSSALKKSIYVAIATVAVPLSVAGTTRPPFDAPGNTLRHRNPFLYARPAIPISVDDFVLLGFVASKKTKNRRQQKHIDNRKTKELKKKREEN